MNATAFDLIDDLQRSQRSLARVDAERAQLLAKIEGYTDRLKSLLLTLPIGTVIDFCGRGYRIEAGRVIEHQIRHGCDVPLPPVHVPTDADCGCPVCLEETAELKAVGAKHLAPSPADSAGRAIQELITVDLHPKAVGDMTERELAVAGLSFDRPEDFA